MKLFVFVLCGLLSHVTFAVMAEKAEIDTTNFKLLSGDSMPLVGFGTYLIQGQKPITDSLDHALHVGYRLIDTAYVYRNEEEIGKALKILLPKYNLTRKDIFVTSKLPPSGLGAEKIVHDHLQTSLRKLQLDYLDLYLIHWPGAGGKDPQDPSNPTIRSETWKGMVSAQGKGLVKNIGVSNYNVKHLKEVFANSHGILPAVNQVEWHPYYHPEDLFKFCSENKILLQAYSSLGGTKNSAPLVKNPIVVKVADKLGVSPAQVLLKWAVQQNIAVIPKSTNEEHIKKNFQLNFTIPAEDMKALSDLPRQKYAWDPDTVN